MKTSSRYLVVDQCQVSASYNYCLLHGLAAAGAPVTYACSEFVHEDMPPLEGVQKLQCFFRIATFVNRFFPHRRLRQLLRVAEYPLNVAVLLAYILIKRIRVVHFMWSLTPTFDYWMYRLIQRMGCRLVYTAHNPFPHERKPSDEAKFARLYRSVDHIIVLTQNTANEIHRVCDIPTSRISVIPHGDYGPLHAHFPCNETLVEEVKTKAAGRRIVAFLGLIRPYKGLDYFIEAFVLIQKRMPETFFLIAGNVVLGNEAELRASVEATGHADATWVDFRFLPTSDIKAYLAVMDVLVMPYLNASQSGNTVMAYAAGVPVVATDVGGLAEMTHDGETGFVIPPRDSQAIADAVCRCFEGERLQQMSAKALHASEHEFGWATIARQTIQAYEGERSNVE